MFAAEKLKLKPEECVVYEDAEAGVDAAKTGGFYAVGIGPSNRVGHADVRFDSMSEATLDAVRTFFDDLFL